MCLLLNQTVLDGNSKKSQIKEWERYFNFEKIGQRFLITEVYDKPFQKNDCRRNGNNSIYVKYIELILMYFLLNKDGYCYTLKKNDWYRTLGLINENYIMYKQNQRVLDLTNGIINQFDIKDFYRRVPPKLEKILFSALRNMKNRCLLEYSEENIIAETVAEEKIYRLASNREIKEIIEAKNEVLKHMGFESISQVFLRFKSTEFYDCLNMLLNERYGWDYTYKQYKIIYSQKCIREDISKTQIAIEKIQLNQSVVDAVNEQAKDRFYKNQEEYDKACDIFIEKWQGFGVPNPTDKDLNFFHYRDTYLDAQTELADYFLKL